MAIRVELCGRLIKAPEVRVTPAGAPILRLVVDCGERDSKFVMEVVMSGDSVHELARHLSAATAVRATGVLRQVRGRPLSGVMQQRIEVLADCVTVAEEGR